MTKTSLFTTIALTGALAGLLAGCSSSDEPAPTPTPTTTADAAPADDTCVDGVAWMQFDESGETEKSLPEGCATIVVNGNGGTLTAGPADTLVIMGNDNTVDLGTVGQIDLEGTGNTITHTTDADPVVNTDNDTNTVTRAG
jgi:hypothetical protein